MIRLLALLVTVLVLSACSSTEPDSAQAQQLSMQELTEAPGYAWFPAEMQSYTPRDVYVQQVSANFNADQKVCVFVRPSCSCTGTQKLFPQIIKTLTASGVDMSKVEIWSMRSESDRHPYMSNVTITDLPTIWVLSKGNPMHEIIETQYNLANADSLIAAALVP